VQVIVCCVTMKDGDCSAVMTYWVVEESNVVYVRVSAEFVEQPVVGNPP